MPWEPSIGRPWQVNCAASVLVLTFLESGKTLTRWGWMVGATAPAGVAATPTPSAAAVAEAVSTAASFNFSGVVLTDMTPRLRWDQPVTTRVDGGGPSSNLALPVVEVNR